MKRRVLVLMGVLALPTGSLHASVVRLAVGGNPNLRLRQLAEFAK